MRLKAGLKTRLYFSLMTTSEMSSVGAAERDHVLLDRLVDLPRAEVLDLAQRLLEPAGK